MAPEASAAAASESWVIEPVGQGAVANIREMWRYRKLLAFFALQSIQNLYRGTTLGIFWLFARPLFPILIGTFVFGSLLQISSDGLPYFLFFLSGMGVWTLFDRSLLWVTRSLEQERELIKKLYFPRLIVPISAVSPAMVYFLIYMSLIILAGFYYLVTTGRWYLPLGPGWLIAVGAALLGIAIAISVGLFTTVWQTKHKDVRFGLRYFTSFWFYLTPVIYPMSAVPPDRQWVIYLNPMSSVVETFKWGLLGVGQFPVLPLMSSLALTIVAGAAGVWYFNRSEAASVDDM